MTFLCCLLTLLFSNGIGVFVIGLGLNSFFSSDNTNRAQCPTFLAIDRMQANIVFSNQYSVEITSVFMKFEALFYSYILGKNTSTYTSHLNKI